MIKAIETYIVTDGNGKEAIEFYRQSLNADVLEITFWKDKVPNCPEKYENLVLNAQLVVNGVRFMISDNNPEFPYILGNNLTPAIIVDNVKEAREIYTKLSKDARVIEMEFQETFWSPGYAIFTDKFGVSWQVNTEFKK